MVFELQANPPQVNQPEYFTNMYAWLDYQFHQDFRDVGARHDGHLLAFRVAAVTPDTPGGLEFLTIKKDRDGFEAELRRRNLQDEAIRMVLTDSFATVDIYVVEAMAKTGYFRQFAKQWRKQIVSVYHGLVVEVTDTYAEKKFTYIGAEDIAIDKNGCLIRSKHQLGDFLWDEPVEGQPVLNTR